MEMAAVRGGGTALSLPQQPESNAGTVSPQAEEDLSGPRLCLTEDQLSL